MYPAFSISRFCASFGLPSHALSLHVCVEVNLANGEIHCSNSRNLSRIDPGVTLGRRGEAYVFTKVGDPLGGVGLARKGNVDASALRRDLD